MASSLETANTDVTTDENDALTSSSRDHPTAEVPRSSDAKSPGRSDRHAADGATVDPSESTDCPEFPTEPKRPDETKRPDVYLDTDHAAGESQESDPNAQEPYAIMRIKIEQANGFSIMFLMSSSKLDTLAVVGIALVPSLVMLLLTWWFVDTAYRDYYGEMETVIFGLYTSDGLVGHQLTRDYTIIVLVYFGLMWPKMSELWKALIHFGSVVSFCRQCTSYKNRMVFAAFVAFIVDGVLCPLFAFGLGLSIALFLSDQFLINVLINFLVLDFVNDLDRLLLEKYVSCRYPNASIFVSIEQVVFKVSDADIDKYFSTHPMKGSITTFYRSLCQGTSALMAQRQWKRREEKAFWSGSNWPKTQVLQALRRESSADDDYDRQWSLLIDRFRGLGMSRRGGTSCSISIRVHDWDLELNESNIHSVGSQLFAVLAEKEWNDKLSKLQRETLFQHLPRQAARFPFAEDILDCGRCRKWTSPDHVSALVEAIKRSANLREVALGEDRVETTLLHAVRDGLNGNTSIVELDFTVSASVGDVDDERASALATILSHNKAVQSVRFSKELTMNGLRLVGDAMVKHAKLSDIDLSQNELENEGAQTLARVVTANPGLVRVACFGMRLGDAGFRLLINALMPSTMIRTIAANNNAIGTEGAHALAAFLVVNRSLESVWIGDTPCSVSGLQPLVEALKKNSTLKEVLYARKENEGDEYEAMLEDVASVNPIVKINPRFVTSPSASNKDAMAVRSLQPEGRQSFLARI